MALSSAAARSQIQTVLGESSSLVASRLADASKTAAEQPLFASATDLPSAVGAGGENSCVARMKVRVID